MLLGLKLHKRKGSIGLFQRDFNSLPRTNTADLHVMMGIQFMEIVSFLWGVKGNPYETFLHINVFILTLNTDK